MGWTLVAALIVVQVHLLRCSGLDALGRLGRMAWYVNPDAVNSSCVPRLSSWNDLEELQEACRELKEVNVGCNFFEHDSKYIVPEHQKLKINHVPSVSLIEGKLTDMSNHYSWKYRLNHGPGYTHGIVPRTIEELTDSDPNEGFHKLRHRIYMSELSYQIDHSITRPSVLVLGVDPMGLHIPSCMVTMMYRLMEDCKWKVPLLTELDWYFIPLGNPDGFYFNTVTVTNMKTHKVKVFRKNRSRQEGNSTCYGVNIDRNFGFNWGLEGEHGGRPVHMLVNGTCDTEYYAGDRPFSEVESTVLQNLILGLERLVQLYIVIETSDKADAGAIVFPWSSSESTNPNYNTLMEWASNATKVIKMQTGTDFGIFQASQYHRSAGTIIDWLQSRLPDKFIFSIKGRSKVELQSNLAESVQEFSDYCKEVTAAVFGLGMSLAKHAVENPPTACCPIPVPPLCSTCRPSGTPEIFTRPTEPHTSHTKIPVPVIFPTCPHTCPSCPPKLSEPLISPCPTHRPCNDTFLTPDSNVTLLTCPDTFESCPICPAIPTCPPEPSESIISPCPTHRPCNYTFLTTGSDVTLLTCPNTLDTCPTCPTCNDTFHTPGSDVTLLTCPDTFDTCPICPAIPTCPPEPSESIISPCPTHRPCNYTFLTTGSDVTLLTCPNTLDTCPTCPPKPSESVISSCPTHRPCNDTFLTPGSDVTLLTCPDTLDTCPICPAIPTCPPEPSESIISPCPTHRPCNYTFLTTGSDVTLLTCPNTLDTCPTCPPKPSESVISSCPTHRPCNDTFLTTGSDVTLLTCPDTSFTCPICPAIPTCPPEPSESIISPCPTHRPCNDTFLTTGSDVTLLTCPNTLDTCPTCPPESSESTHPPCNGSTCPECPSCSPPPVAATTDPLWACPDIPCNITCLPCVAVMTATPPSPSCVEWALLEGLARKIISGVEETEKIRNELVDSLLSYVLLRAKNAQVSKSQTLS